MPRALHHAAVAALLALLAAQAMALGIGKVTNQTMLGSSLRFAVDLRLDAGESVAGDCITVEAVSGESRLPPSTLRWALEPGADPADRVLRVASSVTIDEPVVTLNVQFTCPTRLTRKFVAFVDPPTLAQAAALPPMPMPRVEPATAPVLKAVEAARAEAPAPASDAAEPRPRRAPTKTAAARGAAPHAAVRTAAAAPARSRASTPQKTARVPSAAAPQARLRLEAADDAPTRERLDLRQASAAASAAAATVAVAASAPDDAAAQQARERMQALEESLARLQAEGRATQASLAQLQSMLREAELQRYANGLVYGLGALAAALAAALVVVLWKRPAAQGAAWWAPAAEPDAAAPEDDARAAQPAVARRSDDAPLVETTASPMMLSQAHALAQEPPLAVQRIEETDPAMAVEELIDLEQQAEFFVVLGQEEAAIDLLMSHLRSSGGASPLPYLKLLEIYRRRGDREASERIRERFNRRFNAYAPEWQADPLQGRTLTDYPSVIASLQSLWSTPAAARRALEASLFRRDGASSTFDLPAYRELLFLYSVARDLDEHDAEPANVDLLLPIGADGADGAQLTRLHSKVAPVRLDPPAEVDVDITALDPGLDDADDRSSRLHTDFSATSSPMALAVAASTTRH